MLSNDCRLRALTIIDARFIVVIFASPAPFLICVVVVVIAVFVAWNAITIWLRIFHLFSNSLQKQQPNEKTKQNQE